MCLLNSSKFETATACAKQDSGHSGAGPLASLSVHISYPVLPHPGDTEVQQSLHHLDCHFNCSHNKKCAHPSLTSTKFLLEKKINLHVRIHLENHIIQSIYFVFSRLIHETPLSLLFFLCTKFCPNEFIKLILYFIRSMSHKMRMSYLVKSL